VIGRFRDFAAEMLNRRQIVTGQHCCACAAGGGPSCTGAIVKYPRI
jgi:hypothetical protein